MQKYKKPKIDESKLIVNPFSGPLQIPVNKHESVDKFELKDKIVMPLVLNSEYERSVKFYLNKSRRSVYSTMSPSSNKLLVWVLQELVENKDFFWLNKDRFKEEAGMAHNTYKKSIDELQLYGLLAATIYPDVFWINPHYFFFGNRVNKYPKSVYIKQNRAKG
jgi:hypothetical protein